MKWEPYDPTWLVALAREQRPNLPWFADALAACTVAQREIHRRRRHGRRVREAITLYFVSRDRANQPGADWQINGSVWLRHQVHGNLNVDILKEERVGGIEFYDRLFSNPKVSRP